MVLRGRNQFTSAWSKEEEDWIVNEYPTATFKDYENALPNRTINSIKHKASKMGIIKTIDTISKQNSMINKGKVRTEENKKKISIGLKGIKKSTETREKRRIAMINVSSRGEEHHRWKGNDIHRDHCRWRARKLVAKGKCSYCDDFGRDVHHRDGNPYNNDPIDLLRLCIKHHKVEHQVMKALLKAIELIDATPDYTLERQLVHEVGGNSDESMGC